MEPHALVVLGSTQYDLLPLEELVDPNKPAHILAVRARLPSEAGRESEELYRELFQVKRLAHVVAHTCHFTSACQVLAILGLVEVLLALGQVAGTHKGLPAHERGDNHRDKALLTEELERQLPYRHRQQNAISLQEIATEASDFGPAFEVGHTERRHQLDVSLGFEVKCGRLAPFFYLHVFSVTLALRHTHVGDVRHGEHESLPFLYHLLELIFTLRHTSLQLPHGLKQFVPIKSFGSYHLI